MGFQMENYTRYAINKYLIIGFVMKATVINIVTHKAKELAIN